MSEDSRMQILIVEDERNHADVLAALLERSGYRVRVADTFEAGKRMLESSAPDLVITDLDLGAHRGTELLGVAQALARPVEVMLISGVGSIEDAVEAMQLGAVHYFTKPLDVKEIRAVVGEAAAAPRRHKRIAPLPDLLEVRHLLDTDLDLASHGARSVRAALGVRRAPLLERPVEGALREEALVPPAGYVLWTAAYCARAVD